MRLLHGPTRESYEGGAATVAGLTTEDDLNDGHRAFVYAKVSFPCTFEGVDNDDEDDCLCNCHGNKTFDVNIRFYNEWVHAMQADMDYDNTDASAGLPKGWVQDDPGETYRMLTEKEAFDEGYIVYDLVKAWSHLDSSFGDGYKATHERPLSPRKKKSKENDGATANN